MEQLLDCSPSTCAIVAILFTEVVWGRDWASGAATLAVIVKRARTRLIAGSITGIWAAGGRQRRWLGCEHMIEALCLSLRRPSPLR
ncbi:hypothetical protein K469DRAFT_41847 [Zopfia rhizophila CBS 207.26]|uniref:Uncharacterized protein n=1 Tax=Zopfia rhizophila CBS 207.26 TaxID=1314779 RepID=A0A6A6EFA1_9PEZI|nr:hypothetical protein K469DRAFT_41847 [Zopfia rhizophila CBS 207.26]